MAASGMPRPDILAALEGLAPVQARRAYGDGGPEAAAAERQPGAAAEQQLGEGAVLGMVASCLHGSAARQHLPALLQRLLPAEGGSGSGSGDGAAAPQAQPLPLEAELLQARALAPPRWQCANVRCPTLAAGADPTDLQEARGKRCGGCKAVKYCGTGCSHLDWQAGHRRVCRQLAAERQARQQAAAAEGGAQ